MNPDGCSPPGLLVLVCRKSGVCCGGATPARHGCSTPWRSVLKQTPAVCGSLRQFFSGYCVDRYGRRSSAEPVMSQSDPNNPLAVYRDWSRGRRSRVEHRRHNDSCPIPKRAGHDRIRQFGLVLPRRAGLVDSAPMVERTCTVPEPAARFEAAVLDAAKPGKTMHMYPFGSRSCSE